MKMMIIMMKKMKNRYKIINQIIMEKKQKIHLVYLKLHKIQLKKWIKVLKDETTSFKSKKRLIKNKMKRKK